MQTLNTKTCKCGATFAPRNAKQYMCAVCEKDYKRQYYIINKQRISDRIRKYKLARPEWRKAVAREYFKNHRDKVRIYRSSITYYISRLLTRARVLAHESGRIIDIDFDFLMQLWNTQNGRCRLTGISMTHRHKDIRSVSIDRIDSTQGYTRDNVQLVCKFINLGKNSATNDEVIALLLEICNAKSMCI
jgi:hypothetical protein